MSKREDIVDGSLAASLTKELVYTEVLGWIDLGHARGGDIRELLKQIENGESSRRSFYDVTYSQGMSTRAGLIRSGKAATWRIRRGRPQWEIKSIALALMMAVAMEFESFQARIPQRFLTDSGFSGEDLVSDLLGFYRVVSSGDLFSRIRPVSKEKALRRWDHYGAIGKWKNRSFLPLLFPEPSGRYNAVPKRGKLPLYMQTVVPYNDFLSGNVIIPPQHKTFMVLGAGNGRMGL